MATNPREHLRWNLLDQPGDPVPWNSYEARSLKTFYERLADAADQAATDLRRLEGDKLGEGETIKALKELVEELPSHLDKAHTAYEKGYKALETWADALDAAREKSETVAILAAGAYDGLADDERDTWKEGEGGDDPLREEYVVRLRRVTDDLDEAAETAKNALEDAKQGDPNKLWGWLDAIVTWVEENPLIYAAIMVVAGIAAIFIPGLGIALAIAALSISAATLHREGKLGFNMETVLTLGLDAMSLIPGGVLLRGGRAVSRVAGPFASRASGPVRRGVRTTANAVRNNRAVQTVTTNVGRAKSSVSSTINGNRALRVGADFVATGTKDTAVGMGSSIAVQMAGGTSWEDINLTNELIGAAATNFPAAGVSAGKTEWDLSHSSSGSGSSGTTTTGSGGGDNTPDIDTPDIDVDTAPGGDGSGGGGSTDGGGNDPTAANDAGAPRSGDDPATPGSGDGSVSPTGADGAAPPQTGADPQPFQAEGPGSSGDAAPAQTSGDTQTTQAADTTSAQTAGDTGPTHTDGGDTGSTQSGGDTSTSQSSGGDGSSSRTDGDPGSVSGDTAQPRMPDAPDPDQYDDLGEGGVAVTRNAPAGNGGGDFPARSQNRIGDPDPDSSGQRDADTPGDTTSPTPRASGDGTTDTDDPAAAHEPDRPTPNPDTTRPSDATTSDSGPTTDGPNPDTSGPEDTPTPDTPAPAGERIDVEGARGEYRTVEGPDGQPNVTYRYPTGDGDYTMTVSPDDVTVNGTSVQRQDNGFQVTNADGASVSVSNGERGQPGTIDLTSPDGERGPSYSSNGSGGSDRPGHADHPGEVRVPTRDGDVSAYRGRDGATIRTDDGLTVNQSRDGAAQITHNGDGAVDLRFNDGPRVNRPEGEPGATPRTTVTDPRSGRTAQVGSDGYRVDTGDGATHGYDRGTDTATLDANGSRVEAGPDSVRVTDESRGVDMRQGRDGRGTAVGAGSGGRVREDGSAEIRTDNPTATPHATLGADGHAQVGGTQAWPGQVVNPDGSGVWIRPGRVDPVSGDRMSSDTIEVRGPDGSARSYGMDGRALGEYPSLSPNPGASGSSAHASDDPSSFTMDMGGNRITVTSGSDPTVRADIPSGHPDHPRGWSVTASRGGEVSVSAPPDARGDRLQVTNRQPGEPGGKVSTDMSTDLHRIGSGPDGVTADASGGVHAGSTERGSHVGDGTLRTEVTSDGHGGAETRTPSGDPVAGHSGSEGHVATDSGVTVRTRGDEVTADVPKGSNQTVRDGGGRTIDVRPDGTTMRGPSPDTPESVPLRMGETAGDAGRVPPGWRVETTSDGSMAASTHPDNEIIVRSPDDMSRTPHITRNPDDVEYRNGDVNGNQTRSGRNEVSDGNGTTVRDSRRGVRVTSGDDSPELRITEDQVRVTTATPRLLGTVERQDVQIVDIPTARPDTGTDAPRPGSGGGAPAPGRDASAPTPRQDSDAPDARRDTTDTTDTTDTDGSTRPESGDGRSDADGSPGNDRRGDDASGDGDPPVRSELNSMRTTLVQTGETFVKNVLNVLGGLAAEHLWIGEPGVAGIQTADVVQAFTQLGTSVPKGLAEARMGDMSDLPPGVAPFGLEMSHQAARNMWRDDTMDAMYEEQVDTAGELNDVKKSIDFLNDVFIPEIDSQLENARNNGAGPEELERLEALREAAENQRESLVQQRNELHEEITHRTPGELWDGLTDRG
ncbi:hypothetical protein KIK06_20330 [Nocardiopsis sp. EMB25]|uniref:hypothetical protein n=1 Tax=Nocardiopsis sp. EMB25 TaxID=2835867 RepID=UPI002283CA13|nr:hypothetical protein [Nocardiopsis sp. EMB25]MCY9786245.1 hypothetical protein [Nocardiopsis sp. EMB25]